MVDASEMMEFLPAGVDHSAFIDKIGSVKPGAEALWVEAEVAEGLPSRHNVRRIGAMVHLQQDPDELHEGAFYRGRPRILGRGLFAGRR